MKGFLLLLSLVWLLLLLWEALQARKARASLRHVVHVNGTRGKSTVSRLIEAGLRAGGWRVLCKTTGTDPMIIGVDGVESPIIRRGKANIKEQVKVLRLARRQGAEVLVAECMAVQPELQRVSQHRILQGDIGVITNVRLDHADVMGESLEEICDALASTIPAKGVLFTGEECLADRLKAHCGRLSCEFIPARPDGGEPAFDFPENIALALAVCERLGVSREQALEGMAHHRPDPYALSVYRLGADLLINAMAVNDAQSTQLVLERVRAQLDLEGRPLVVLVNNRPDRGTRTREMLALCVQLAPSEVWLLGADKGYMARGLQKALPKTQVTSFGGAGELSFSGEPGRAILAVGNIAAEGKILMKRASEEGERIV